MKGRLALVFVLLATVWHGWAVWGKWEQASRYTSGPDFSTYYYAVKVAQDGKNPYVKRELKLAGSADGVKSEIHPFFYPPPFLLVMSWTSALDGQTAYRVWFWLDELFTLLCVLVLFRWWKPMGSALPVVLAAAVATLTAIPNNHVMGQFNLPVLFLVLFGLASDSHGRTYLAGILLGFACMLKMSPALFVAWWIIRGRHESVVVACATAVLLSAASLALIDLDTQKYFYTEVLPGFGSGDYNGLKVPITLFGNHSIPDLFNRIYYTPARGLSESARLLSTTAALFLVCLVGFGFRREPRDPWAAAGQIGAVALVMLLIPVYTYEHHLIWAIPAFVVVGTAFLAGRVPWFWGIPLVLAWFVWAFDLQILKTTYETVQADQPVLGVVLRDAKFASLVVMLWLTVDLGRSIPQRDTSTADSTDGTDGR